MGALISHGVARYTIAVVAVLLATLARYLLDVHLGDHLFFVTYLVAIVLVTWIGGTGPSLVTLVSGGLLSTYLFAPERLSFHFTSLEYQLGLASYLFIGGTAIAVNESLRGSLRRAEEARHAAVASENQLKDLNDTLEQRVAERTAVAEQRAAQLRALASQLTRAEEQERRRLSQILHDHLQQLLVGARIHLGLVRRHIGDERLREAVAEIDDLLEQAIGESRSLTVELSPPILYDAGLAAALAWLGQQTQEKHALEVEVRCGPEPEPIEPTSRALLYQAVRELLFNAVKHACAHRAEVTMAWNQGRLQIEVCDDGVGFDPARLEVREGNGGFGLFSVRERLEVMGGRLEIDAAPGRGSRFVLDIPLEASAPAAPPPAPPLRGPASFEACPRQAGRPRDRGKGVIRILLADDHPIVHKGLADLLGELPEVDLVGTARDGEEAVEMALQHRPDVVVMDVAMPRQNGIEATRQIKFHLPETRVIGLSMHEEEHMAKAMREAGAACYLIKSDAPESLLAAIRVQARDCL